jgi:putative FmdB family regulatory protein
MPTYAYECRDCGVRFDRHQSFHDDPITVCPECGGEVHRLIQPAGIIFKGSGFYVTDNKGRNPAAPSVTSARKEDAGTSTSGGDKTEAATESKPAAKAETAKSTD